MEEKKILGREHTGEQGDEVKKITCSGCSNLCYLDVVMKDGKVEEVTGGGCRRAVVSARRQLERAYP